MKVLGMLENVMEDKAEVYKQGEFYNVVSENQVTRKCLNLGSYNYLGFADDWSTTCEKDVVEIIE